MKACGILCEYNPFHNGHIHHIQETKKLVQPDVLVCVMSGNFVQRGESAICNKWERAKVAVEHGCDLVIELPFIYSTQSATYFAKGGMDCLKLAQVSDVVFGSESNDIEILKTFSTKNPDTFKELKKQGISSAKAYEKIYGPMNANDILGLNYLKELKDSLITPHTIQRTNNYHEKELNTHFSSATSIRKAVFEHQDYQKSTPMQNLPTTFSMNNYYPLIRQLLLSSDIDDLKQLFLMDEGIEGHLIKHAKKASSYEEFITSCTTKRYSKASIQRTLVHLINQTKKSTVNHLPPITTLRVLAYNDTGKKYLKQLKDNGVSIASRFSQIPKMYQQMELKAAYTYAYPLLSSKDFYKEVQKELQPPIYIKNSH